MFFSTNILTALLVACASAAPDDSPMLEKMLIGYRTVSDVCQNALLIFHSSILGIFRINKRILTLLHFKKEARSITGIGWLYWDEKKMPAGSTVSGQFGVGKSLADRAGTWPSLQPGAMWRECCSSSSCALDDRLTPNTDCYVTADPVAFAAAKKVHLPNPKGEWSEENTVEAIKAIPSAASWDANEVLRFGLCDPVNELLIPKHMLGQPTKKGGPGPLGLATHCYKSVKVLKEIMKGEGYGEAPAVDFTKFSLTAAKRGLELEARGRKTKGLSATLKKGGHSVRSCSMR